MSFGKARDSGEIQMMRDQFIGETKGLSALEKTLDYREKELRDIILQQDNNNELGKTT